MTTIVVVVVVRLRRGECVPGRAGDPPPTPKLYRRAKLAATLRAINHIEQRAIGQRMAVAVIIRA